MKMRNSNERNPSPDNEEDDLQDKYYNFDKPVISSSALLGKDFKPENLAFKNRIPNNDLS